MELVAPFLEFQSDMGVDKLHKSFSTDLHESDHWWHYIVFISDSLWGLTLTSVKVPPNIVFCELASRKLQEYEYI